MHIHDYQCRAQERQDHNGTLSEHLLVTPWKHEDVLWIYMDYDGPWDSKVKLSNQNKAMKTYQNIWEPQGGTNFSKGPGINVLTVSVVVPPVSRRISSVLFSTSKSDLAFKNLMTGLTEGTLGITGNLSETVGNWRQSLDKVLRESLYPSQNSWTGGGSTKDIFDQVKNVPSSALPHWATWIACYPHLLYMYRCAHPCAQFARHIPNICFCKNPHRMSFG